MNDKQEDLFGDKVKGYSIPRRRPEMIPGGGFDRHILICSSDVCLDKGAYRVKSTIYGRLNEEYLDNVKISAVSSFHHCERGPTLAIYPDDVWYRNLSPDDASRIVDDHLLNDEPVEECRFQPALPDDYTLFVICAFHAQCAREGAGQVLAYFREKARERPDTLIVKSNGCLKECSMGPVVCTYPRGNWYTGVKEYKFDDIWENEVEHRTASKFKSGSIRIQQG